MKADTKNLEELFAYLRKIIIPAYQRNYSWTEEVANQLLEDILEINSKDRRYKHFVGPIVSIIHNSESSCRILIDGQQRITTILILLIALKNLVEKNKVEVEDKELFIKEIDIKYLFNELKKDEERIKLKPYNKDNENYLNLLKDECIDKNTCIFKNYLFFKNEIERLYIEESLNIDNLFETIKTRIIFVDIQLEASSTDNAQDIFESLNSKGQDLTNADLIRNLILMNKDEYEQDEIYKKYWEKIENNCGIDNVDKFIRYWLIYKNNSFDSRNSPKEKGTDIYKKFKYFLKDKNIDLYELLKELLQFSNYYKIILNNEFERINIINDLDITISYPFIFYMFYLKDKGIIDDNTIIEALKIIENYAFRRYICNYPTSVLSSVFFNLKKDMGDVNNTNFIDKMSHVLLSKNGHSYFPRDQEFIENLQIKNFKANKSKVSFLLRELEQFNNKEKVNFSNLTLEHIIPQTLTEEWKKYLGDKWQEIYDKYLWNIGNLTYTGYNSEMQNKGYHLKKPFYINSSLTLNRNLPDEFKENDIKNRAKELSILANTRWPLAKTTISLEKKKDYYTIYDDWTNKKPVNFEFLGEIYKENSLLNILKKVVEILLELDNTKLMNFIKTKQNRNLNNEMTDSCRILINEEYGIYSYPLSADSITKLLRDLFGYFDLSEEELKVYMK